MAEYRLQEGDDAPAFDLADAEGKRWRSEDLRGQRVVLYFYPADSTPGCTVQACDFRDAIDDFAGAGYQVLGVSPQGESSKRRFTDKYSLNFPLLIDEGLAVAETYGAVKERLGRKGVLRSTFVISEEGKIEQALYGVRSKGHVESLLGEIVSA